MCSQDNGDMKKQHALFKQYGTINDWIVTGALLAVATCLSYIFFHIMDNPTANIALCYILALFLTARFTGFSLRCLALSVSTFYLHILILRWTLH